MHIDSIQVGQARRIMVSGRSVMTAIRKTRLEGLVPVMPLGLLGDEQVDLSVHGGLEKAVYAYPAEHYGFWQERRREAGLTCIDEELPHGAVGENLTLRGLLEDDVWVGDVLRFAGCVLRVEQPREPCFKFNAVMGYKTAVKDMAQSGFCGFYLSVDTPGVLQSGESFELIPGPRRVSIVERFNAKMFKHMR